MSEILIIILWQYFLAFGSSVGKESICNAGDVGDVGSIPGSGRCPGGDHDNPPHVFLLGESPGQRSLVGCSP